MNLKLWIRYSSESPGILVVCSLRCWSVYSSIFFNSSGAYAMFLQEPKSLQSWCQHRYISLKESGSEYRNERVLVARVRCERSVSARCGRWEERALRLFVPRLCPAWQKKSIIRRRTHNAAVIGLYAICEYAFETVPASGTHCKVQASLKVITQDCWPHWHILFISFRCQDMMRQTNEATYNFFIIFNFFFWTFFGCLQILSWTFFSGWHWRLQLGWWGPRAGKRVVSLSCGVILSDTFTSMYLYF